MDALPIEEETGAAWAPTTKGVTHACGHDGHTAMLLGAARDLARTRDFDGTAVVVLQPAEGEAAAARPWSMMASWIGLLGISEVYAMHTEPVMDSEHFAFMLEARPGNIMQIGNGGRAGLHESRFDFNDGAIPFGIAYFRTIVEAAMPR